MEKLKAAFEFIAPSTPTGFLAYGWIGGILASLASDVIIILGASWLFQLVVPFLIFIPLWIRAKRFREEQMRLQEVVLWNETHRVLTEENRMRTEENVRSDNTD